LDSPERWRPDTEWAEEGVMNECMAPTLEAPAAWPAANAGRPESADGDSPAVLPREAAVSLRDYVWFAVEQQGVYCQLV
jgi:hypothetical protein